MLIGIDASRANHPEKTGVERYAYEIICQLGKLDKENSYRLYLWEEPREGLAKLPGNFEPVLLPNRRFWTHTTLVKELWKNPVDRLFVPSHLVPWRHPKDTIVTIHDLGFLDHHENYSRYHYLNLAYGTKWSAKWSEKIIVPSEAVAADVSRTYQLPLSKLNVIPHGYDRGAYKDLTPERVATTMQEYHVNDPYLIFVGRLEARKNVSRVIEAFYRLRDSGLFGGQLVLVGNPGVGYDDVRELIAKRDASYIVQTGYVSDEERAALLAGARGLVFPSLHEGFGIPILEAFAAGTPVITADRGAPAEVAGKAAALVNPESVEDIHQAMEHLLADQKYAQGLTRAGLARAKEYSWRKAAAETLKVLTT